MSKWAQLGPPDIWSYDRVGPMGGVSLLGFTTSQKCKMFQSFSYLPIPNNRVQVKLNKAGERKGEFDVEAKSVQVEHLCVIQEKLLTVTLVTVTQYRAIWLQ